MSVKVLAEHWEAATEAMMETLWVHPFISLVAISILYLLFALCAFWAAAKWLSRKHLIRLIWGSISIVMAIVAIVDAQTAGVAERMIDDFCVAMLILLAAIGFYNKKFGT